MSSSAYSIETPEGKALLSWRVAQQPYVEQESLYKRFRLDEAWDSDHNRRLIPMIPRVYLPLWARESPDPSGRTPYQAVVGKGRFKFIAFPLRIRGGTASPVRAVAMLKS